MLSCDRRLGNRVPFEVFLTQYVHDRPSRALSANLSATGIFVHLAKPKNYEQLDSEQPIAMEIVLPGVDETIWACGQACFQRADGLAVGMGIRFTAMAKTHARLIRDFCAETRRTQLVGLLDRIRRPAASA